MRYENVKIKDILKLVTSIVLCQLAGFIGSVFTTPTIPTWYKTLNKPFFTPPNWIFSPVWISLFILMGISLFFVWRRANHPQFKPALIFFFVQLILNILWSVAFFGLRSPLLGLIDIGLLWGTVLLNNKYELNGRDPNGFAGVAWCLGKHDRPWGERPIFGNLRYINDKGLKRKFDADGYVKMIDASATAL
jgi:benzodiazapine receptor